MVERRDVEFVVEGTTCRAWHFHVEGDKQPCVVMAHGLGLTRHCLLERYALRFAEEGIHSLVFDYRCFGDSDGEPRELLSAKRQLGDWAAALRKARTLEGVDPDRIAAWGTSFSGGHVLVAAAEDPGVKAVLSQCPMMDGLGAFLEAARTTSPLDVVKVVGHALRDVASSALGRDAHRIPFVGEPGTLAFLTAPGCVAGYRTLTPDDHRGEGSARFALEVGTYRPVSRARDLRCPMLLLVCDKDDITPPAGALAVANANERVELHHFPVGHFDIYHGEHYEKALDLMTDFLRRTLL